ncbi:MAG: hypothetical protein KF697_10305, partial [Pseudolabrys sp.]|nr:hypothetical protein [Pseudolabrys sp.]
MITRRAALAAGVGFAAPAYADVAWRTLGLGLEHATAPIESTIGDRRLDVVRIDPAFNRFVLLLAGALGRAPQTARQWANEHGLVAATNAGMFRANRLPVGFAKVEGRVIQPAMSADRSVFVFGADEARLLD